MHSTQANGLPGACVIHPGPLAAYWIGLGEWDDGKDRKRKIKHYTPQSQVEYTYDNKYNFKIVFNYGISRKGYIISLIKEA